MQLSGQQAEPLYHGAQRESLEGYARNRSIGRMCGALRSDARSARLFAIVKVNGLDGKSAIPSSSRDSLRWFGFDIHLACVSAVP